MTIRYYVIFFLFLITTQFTRAQSKFSGKTIAVTLDDLPLNIASHVTNSEMRSIVVRLLAKITDEKVPVTAFVNEAKLEVNSKRDPERVAILKIWLDAGIELGNHTYAHKSQNQVPVSEAKEDILRGERTLKELLAQKNKRPAYFRHPYLQTGRDSNTRSALNHFLDSLGYTIAPVTIDNSEWIFSSAFDKAYAKNDSLLMIKIGNEYLSYMRSKLVYFERISDSLFARQIRQILLIHSNRLNSYYFSQLCTMLRNEGYFFISVEEALQDHAYQSNDTFFGAGGISWLHRWAYTQGKRGPFFAGEPETPPYIMEIAGVEYE